MSKFATQTNTRSVSIAGVDTSTLPRMTNADQLEMLVRIKLGASSEATPSEMSAGTQARSDFIFANMRLVLSVIQKYINKKTTQIDDVFQVGCVGLIKAIDNFDPKFGVQFSTYAVPMIIGEIKRFLRDSNSLRVSRSMRDIAYKALLAKEKLIADRTNPSGAEPTIDEIAIELDLPYRAVYFALNATGTTISLDETICDEGNKEIMMRDLVANSSPTSEDWLEDIMLKRAIENLTEREREILSMRYFEGKTQVEVSFEIGISQAQVSRLEKNALDGIKKRL
jgi:RNA polymerase sporulation-specific sigma factor